MWIDATERKPPRVQDARAEIEAVLRSSLQTKAVGE
jgi:hypothetical protein